MRKVHSESERLRLQPGTSSSPQINLLRPVGNEAAPPSLDRVQQQPRPHLQSALRGAAAPYGLGNDKETTTMMKVTQHLWFEKDMEAALHFYTSLIPGSSVLWTSAIPADTPSGPAGSV